MRDKYVKKLIKLWYPIYCHFYRNTLDVTVPVDVLTVADKQIPPPPASHILPHSLSLPTSVVLIGES